MKSIHKSIAFVIPSVVYGGTETLMVSQIKYLHQQGHKVYLIILSEMEALQDEIVLPPDQLLVLHQPYTFLSGSAILKSPAVVSQIGKFLQLHSIEIVVANLPLSQFVMRMVKFFTRKKDFDFCLLHYHHSMQYEESPLDTMSKKVFNKLNSFMAAYADNGNIFVSKAVEKNVKQYFSVKNPFTLPNAIPSKQVNALLANQYYAQQSLPLSAYKIVVPGRLNEAKGQLFFIEAIAGFISKNGLSPGELEIVFAGGGKLLEAIRAEIKKQGLEAYCHITGIIPNDLLLSLMHISDLVVIPSIYEGFGNVAIEGLMTKSLMLTSDAGGLKEIMRNADNGFVFQTLNFESFRSQLQFIFNNREKELINKENLLEEYSSKYSFESHITGLNKIFSSIC